jgi:ubiquinone/menaquinone biosynthesis C-methylase UbiE
MHSLVNSQKMENKHQIQQVVSTPDCLEETYWWAYVRPYAIAFFDHKWIVNLILLGNMVKLRDTALDALGSSIPGHTLQIASVYGEFSAQLVQRIAEGGPLDIVDVVPAQLENLRRKLPNLAPVRLIRSDSTSLKSSDEAYDQEVMFFLLHEMPARVREKTLSEALRVLKPSGIIFTDPWWNSLYTICLNASVFRVSTSASIRNTDMEPRRSVHWLRDC